MDLHLDLRFPVFIPRIVVGELVWVLSHTHQLRRAAGVSLDEADQVQRALTSFENGRGDLADDLIAEQAISRVPDDRHFQRSMMSDGPSRQCWPTESQRTSLCFSVISVFSVVKRAS